MTSALEDFDALQLPEVAETDAVARAVNAVDDHADRRFQADVVADGTDAADARRGDGFILGTGDGEARHQDLHVLDVAHAGVLQQALVERRDRDRHVLHLFFALLRGDHHGGEGTGFVLRGGRRVLRERRQGEGSECREHGGGQNIALRVA